MNENILYTFAKDLSQLYLKTHLKLVESFFIDVAQNFEEELEKWLVKASQTNIKMSLNNPDIFDAIVVLARIRKAHPAGMSASEYSQIVLNDPTIRRYADVLVALRKVSDANDFAVLNPFKGILNAGKAMSDISAVPVDAGSVFKSVKLLDTMFREYLDKILEQAYDDDPSSSKKRKLTRKEKIISLLHYLIRRFSEEISMAYEQTGKMDAIGLSENLNNPKKILQIMYPNMPSHTLDFLIKKARIISNDAIKYIDPNHYDLAFNSIKAEIMRSSSFIDLETYNDYLYESHLSLQKMENIESEESDRIKVSPEAWSFAQNIVLLSIILYLIGNKIK